MRPRPVVGKATLPDAVRRLMDKFDYPDRESPTQVVPILPTLGGGAGGAPSIFIAASDAHDIEKAKADYVCTGVNDELVIQIAVDRLSAPGSGQVGRILLSGGVFTIDTGVLDLDEDIWLQGMGMVGTVLQTADTSGAMILVGSDCVISDLLLDGPGSGTVVGVDSNVGTGTTIQRVFFNDIATAVLAGERLHISDCLSVTVPTFVDAAGGYSNVHIFDNRRCGLIVSGAPGTHQTDWLIVGNQMFDQIEIEDIDGFVIVGNVWQSPNGSNDALITITDCFGGVISDNDIHDAGGYDALTATSCRAILIQDNLFDNITLGIYLNGSDHCLIQNNLLGEGPDQYIGEHGIQLTDSNDNLVSGNSIIWPGQDTDDTFDGIFLSGDSDRNDIWDNKIIGDSGAVQPRYGINVSAATCNDNSYLGNRTGPASDYAQANPYNDAGTATVNTWPGAAAPQGDNLL